MSRSLLPTIAAALALAIAGGSAEALGQATKKAAAPAAASAAAPAAAAPAAAATSANLAASVRDSGLVRLTWVDTQGGADYVIRRTTISGKDTVPEVKFRVPKGQLFFVDKSGMAGTKYSYTLHTQTGRSLSAPIDGKSVPATLPDPLTAKAAAGIPDEFVDGTKWSALGGAWMPDCVTFAQKDDSPATADDTRDQKVTWIGSPCSADVEQVIAAVSLSGLDKLAPFANKLTPPPAFRVGLGYTNSAKANRAGVFFVVQGNLSAVTSAVFEPDQSGKPYATVTPDALSASDKFWIKLRFRKKAAGKKADLFAWVWKDGATEPSDEALAFSCRDLDWPADPVFPALYGGLQAGTNQLSVSFDQILHETYTVAGAPSPTPASGPATWRSPENPLLEAPNLDDTVRIQRVAVTSGWVGLGRWGTLIGIAEPEDPIPVRCKPPICPWVVPTASNTACCGPSLPAGEIETPWPWAGEGTGVEVLAPHAPAPGLMPAAGRDPDPSPFAPVLEGPVPAVGHTAARDGTVRRVSFRPDEEPGPADQPPVHAQPLPNPHEASDPKPQGSSPLELPVIETTPRILRDYGAVATVPDPDKQAVEALAEKDRKFADELIRMALICTIEKIASQNLGVNPTEAEKKEKEIVARTLEAIKRTNDIKEILKQSGDLMKSRPRVVYDAFGYLSEMNLSAAHKEIVLKRAKELGLDQLAKLVVFKTVYAFSGGAIQSAIPLVPSILRGGASPPGQGLGPAANYAAREPRDPFSYQPRVTVVPLPPSRIVGFIAGTFSEIDRDWLSDKKLDELMDDKNGRVWTYHFDHPARFPVTKFGSNCCGFEGEGAIIHEGMRLLVRQDGQYEVRFNITGPPTPLTLRLQLILFAEGKPNSSVGRPIPRTLTLPPVVVQPSGENAFPNNVDGGVDPISYIVSVRGYSQILKESHHEPTDHLLLVKRNGTARFGNGTRYWATNLSRPSGL